MGVEAALIGATLLTTAYGAQKQKEAQKHYSAQMKEQQQEQERLALEEKKKQAEKLRRQAIEPALYGGQRSLITSGSELGVSQAFNSNQLSTTLG